MPPGISGIEIPGRRASGRVRSPETFRGRGPGTFPTEVTLGSHPKEENLEDICIYNENLSVSEKAEDFCRVGEALAPSQGAVSFSPNTQFGAAAFECSRGANRRDG